MAFGEPSQKISSFRLFSIVNTRKIIIDLIFMTDPDRKLNLPK